MIKTMVLFLFSMLSPALLMADVTGTEFNLPSQGASTSKRIDATGYSQFSFQVEYSTVAVPSINLTDGTYSSATVTAISFDGLRGRPSSTTITLTSGNNSAGSIGDEVIRINGKAYTEGIDWFLGVTSTNTMKSLRDAINEYFEYYANVSSNVVSVIARSSGTLANSWTVTSSTNALVVTSWGGGQEFGYLTINGTTLTEQTDFNAVTSSAVTANSIEEAINNNSILNQIVFSTHIHSTSGTVLIRSSNTGIFPYGVSVSSTSYLRVSVPNLTAGTTTDINVQTETFSEVNHGYGQGLRLLFQRVSGNVPTGLVNGTTYWAIPKTSDTFQLATSATGAVAGANIFITSNTGGGSFTLAPLTFSAGSAGFDWRGSNDGTDYYLLNTASVTYTGHGGGLWSFIDYAYKYILFNFTGPTSGGITIDATFNGRR